MSLNNTYLYPYLYVLSRTQGQGNKRVFLLLNNVNRLLLMKMLLMLFKAMLKTYNETKNQTIYDFYYLDYPYYC